MESQTNTNRASLARVFPHLAPVTCICFVFWLVRYAVYVCCDWPCRVITLVLRQSIEHCSVSAFDFITILYGIKDSSTETHCWFWDLPFFSGWRIVWNSLKIIYGTFLLSNFNLRVFHCSHRTFQFSMTLCTGFEYHHNYSSGFLFYRNKYFLSNYDRTPSKLTRSSETQVLAAEGNHKRDERLYAFRRIAFHS